QPDWTCLSGDMETSGGLQECVYPAEEIRPTANPAMEKKYGQKGYGSDQGTGTHTMDRGERLHIKPECSTSQAYNKSRHCKICIEIQRLEECSRYGDSVYAAKMIIGAGNLESTMLTEKEGEICCKGCNAKNSVPKGFIYGQEAGAFIHAQ
uniref:Uncharacterized protein n=1 Tax=Sciurus vulgaris TaxID=55149 RepID=A0A8D2AQF1_SCIVU